VFKQISPPIGKMVVVMMDSSGGGGGVIVGVRKIVAVGV
jgi:hypothetical protein